MSMKDPIVSDIEQQAPLTREQVEENIRLMDDLKFFLATAPANWQNNQIIRRYYLNTDEGFVSCVYWNNLYFITGTDIVRCVVYRFEQFGREIIDRKKFEEGVFSDLRSLKCGPDAILEPSKSPFLEFLYRNSCLRTQKKQKVFFWFSVPHDRLFTDALERDLKREQMNQQGTTRAVKEPAFSFDYDPTTSLEDQLASYVETQMNAPKDDAESTQLNSTPVSDMLTEPLLSNDTIDITQQSYFIKEENGTPIVTPGRLEDDFPLDYFPQTTENITSLLDPSVFMNPPDTYDEQFLIDQTNAKTPADKRFETRVKDEECDDEETFVMYRPQQHYFSPLVPMGVYAPRCFQPAFYHQPQITNGQFYDAQINGESIPHHQQEYYMPGYYATHHIPYPQYYDQGYEEMYPEFVDERDDGDDELYDAFDRPHTLSPFAKVFPSFQATAPPSSAKSAKFSKSATSVKFAAGPSTARVSKPSSLKQQRSALKLNNEQEEQLEKTILEGQGGDGEEEKSIKGEEDEYVTLPTPESTAPEHPVQMLDDTRDYLEGRDSHIE
jgi:transcription factor STE12